jgi:hypothetical protein
MHGFVHSVNQLFILISTCLTNFTVCQFLVRCWRCTAELAAALVLRSRNLIKSTGSSSQQSIVRAVLEPVGAIRRERGPGGLEH